MSEEQEVPKQDSSKQDAPTYAATATPKKSVSPAAVIAAALALIIFLGYMAYQSFGPLPINLFPQEEQGVRVERLAADNQGDYNRLSPEDKKWMDGISRGNGDKYLRSAYKALQEKSAKK